ncbi:MAG: hypothetical protein ACLRWM_04220 [Streptococcus sp.]
MDDGKWIRIEATAYLDNNIDAQKHMLAAYPSLQKCISLRWKYRSILSS